MFIIKHVNLGTKKKILCTYRVFKRINIINVESREKEAEESIERAINILNTNFPYTIK